MTELLSVATLADPYLERWYTVVLRAAEGYELPALLGWERFDYVGKLFEQYRMLADAHLANTIEPRPVATAEMCGPLPYRLATRLGAELAEVLVQADLWPLR